jgi:hypothetical protein
MHQNDFENFSKLLGRIAEVYGKKLSDGMLQGYWTALKDQPLSTVTRLAEQHMRYAKFLPKPSELRPKEEAPSREAKSDGKFEAAQELAIQNLEYLRQRNPEEWFRRIGDRNAARIVRMNPNAWYDLEAKCWRL